MLYPHTADAESMSALSIIHDASSILRATTAPSNLVRVATELCKFRVRLVDGIVELN